MTRRFQSVRVVFAFLGVFALFSTGCPNGPTKEFTFKIDPQVQPLEAERIGKGGVALPLAAVEDEEGTATQFVANEILIRPSSPEELAQFLARTGGTVVDSDALPAVVDGNQIPVELQTATTFTVKVDASAFPLDNFVEDMTAGLDVGGDSRFSSDLGARLLALIASEAAMGLDVAPNLALTPEATYMDRALDNPRPEPGFFDNSFWVAPQSYDATGSRSSVAAAWSYLALREVTNRVRVAVIDGGFFLDAAGMPAVTGTGGVSDVAIPAGQTRPLQWDAINDDGIANGPNAVNCSGGNPCPWHGTDAAMTATAIVANQFGVAGTGGQVADPILIQSNLTTGSVKKALRMARGLGASIVSMSFGGECDNVFCQFYYTVERYADAFWDAKRAGMLLLAAAGNSSKDAHNTLPCRFNPSVMCIGALNRDDTQAAGYSNFGANVDLFAPAGVLTWGPDSSGVIGYGNYFGTSASTPYTAGVAAMLKAANPALTPDDLQNILTSTGRTDSPDAKVTRYLSAIDALRSVFGNQLDPDLFEENDTAATATVRDITGAETIDFGDLTLDTPEDQDHFRLHVTTWVGLVIRLTTPAAITGVDFVLTRIGGGIAARRTSNVRDTWGRQDQYEGLSPGDYLVTVRHASGLSTAISRETGYNLNIIVNSEGPPRADAFESNNSLAFPYRFLSRRGTFDATTHSATDEDYYLFTVGSLLGTESMHFVIRNRDNPLTLTVYNEAGTPLVETTTGELIMGSGTWRVRVRQPSGLLTRYTFTTLGAVAPTSEESSRFSPRPLRFWRIIMELENIDLSVIRGAEYLLLPAGPRPKSFTVLGNVDVQLMDLLGNVLSEGVQTSNGQGGFFTSLSTAETPGDQEIVMRVTPAGFDASMVDEQEWENSSFATEPFSMYWQRP